MSVTVLNRILGRSASVFDPFEGHALADLGKAHLQMRDWIGLGDIYEGLPPNSAMQFCEGLGRACLMTTVLPQAAPTEGALAVLGGMLATLADRERGGVVNDHDLGHERASRMFERLDHAERLLNLAVIERPGDPAILGWLIRTNTAFGGDSARREVLADCLSRSRARCLSADHNLAMDRTARCNGSQTQMWQTIASACATAPKSGWLGLTARGHIEDWLWHMRLNDDMGQRLAFMARMASSRYRANLLDLDARFLNAAEPEDAETAGERRYAHNQFAILWCILDQPGAARAHVAALDATPSEHPASYVGFDRSMARWNDWREECGLRPLRSRF